MGWFPDTLREGSNPSPKKKPGVRLSESIDNRNRTFDEFLVLLDKADRFKTWLASTSPDEQIITTYLHEVTSKDWLQTLPAKTTRYLFMMALGATHPAIGLVAGVIDTFLLEKLIGGWRPNHFVDARLIPFCKPR